MKEISTEKKVLWFVAFFIAFIAIAIVGFLAIYFVKEYVVTKPPVSQTTSEKTATPSAGFKKFEISNGVVITYPDTLAVNESSYGLGTKTYTFENPKANNDAFAFQAFSVRKNLAKMAGQDFDKFYSMKDGQSQVIESPLDDKKETFTKVKNRTFSNLQAIEYKSSPNPAPKDYVPEIGVIVDVEGTLVLITASEKHRPELEKILNTFTYAKK